MPLCCFRSTLAYTCGPMHEIYVLVAYAQMRIFAFSKQAFNEYLDFCNRS